ncbi:hypothetical protein FIU86_06300 [Roseovarius sp. THAF9]|uniref:hypothetical protein n=1 Tax=Roseovarius sp. THAF9 TaxID=2587847 RepID=UPI0012688767|nr:hypothetical protein [Roseovarius sp. THAF9]QFT92446.1 hypothetical protein FIU86_06300 [Roseovarius sp. THAF9]
MLGKSPWVGLTLVFALAARAAPVEAPNGTVTGHFGGTEFDHPLLCERDPFIIARTHDGDGAPGFEAAFVSNGVTSIEVRTGDETRQFGTSTDAAGFPLVLEGEVDGTAYSFEVACPDGFDM